MNDYAKLRDVFISGNDQTGLFDGKTFGEYVLFGSGRLVIVVPPAMRARSPVIESWLPGTIAGRPRGRRRMRCHF